MEAVMGPVLEAYIQRMQLGSAAPEVFLVGSLRVV